MADTFISRRRAPEPRQRFDEALSTCRDALAHWNDGSTAPREPVIQFVHAARRSGMFPERTLAAFKGMLRSVKRVHGLPLLERTEVTASLAQMVIEAYYDGTDEPRPDPDDLRAEDGGPADAPPPKD